VRGAICVECISEALLIIKRCTWFSVWFNASVFLV